MIVHEILGQHRNDYDAVLRCEHCGEFQLMKNGYADDRFERQVIPAIKCVSCNKRSVEAIPDGITDPGTQGGQALVQREVSVKQWQLK